MGRLGGVPRRNGTAGVLPKPPRAADRCSVRRAAADGRRAGVDQRKGTRLPPRNSAASARRLECGAHPRCLLSAGLHRRKPEWPIPILCRFGRYHHWRAGHSACAKHCAFQRALGAHDCGMERLLERLTSLWPWAGHYFGGGQPAATDPRRCGVAGDAVPAAVPGAHGTCALLLANTRDRRRAAASVFQSCSYDAHCEFSAVGSLVSPVPLVRRRQTAERARSIGQRKRRYRARDRLPPNRNFTRPKSRDGIILPAAQNELGLEVPCALLGLKDGFNKHLRYLSAFRASFTAAGAFSFMKEFYGALWPARRLCLFTIAVLAVVVSPPAPAQHPASSADAPARIARIENGLLPSVVLEGQPSPDMKLADRMQYYHVPGVSIAFFDHGHIAWTRTYGVADSRNGRLVTPETLFQAGSISKPIAALGALALVENGKLKLDQNVNDELTSWQVPENDFTAEQKVTLRRILSHSAGTNNHGFAGYESTQALPSVVQILNGAKPANSSAVQVTAVPGSVWSYSSGGIMVMQLVMMEATSKSFPALMHDLVLGPIGMSHSTYDEPLPLDLRDGAAHGHAANGDPVPGGFHAYPEMAAGGLWSTPSDLALAAIELQNEFVGSS